jgi:hypothetical protein
LHDPVEKPVGLCRIEASQFFDGFQGGSPVAGKEISDPEFIPGVGISGLIWVACRRASMASLYG